MSQDIVDIINQLREQEVLQESLKAALQDKVDDPDSPLSQREKTSLRRAHELQWPSRDKQDYIPASITKAVILEVLAGKGNKEAWTDMACKLLMSSEDLLNKAKNVTHSKDQLARILKEALSTEQGKHLLDTVIVSEEHILKNLKPYYVSHKLGEYVSLADSVDGLEDSVAELQSVVEKHDVEIAQLRLELEGMKAVLGSDGDLITRHKVQYCKNKLRLTQAKTAEAMGVTVRTVQRNWK